MNICGARASIPPDDIDEVVTVGEWRYPVCRLPMHNGEWHQDGDITWSHVDRPSVRQFRLPFLDGPLEGTADYTLGNMDGGIQVADKPWDTAANGADGVLVHTRTVYRWRGDGFRTAMRFTSAPGLEHGGFEIVDNAPATDTIDGSLVLVPEETS